MRWQVDSAPDLRINPRGGTQPRQDRSRGGRYSLCHSAESIPRAIIASTSLASASTAWGPGPLGSPRPGTPRGGILAAERPLRRRPLYRPEPPVKEGNRGQCGRQGRNGAAIVGRHSGCQPRNGPYRRRGAFRGGSWPPRLRWTAKRPPCGHAVRGQGDQLFPVRRAHHDPPRSDGRLDFDPRRYPCRLLTWRRVSA